MKGMNGVRHRVLLPIGFLAGSCFCLLMLALFTSPLNNIAVAVFFFITLLIFLFSLGAALVMLQGGKMSSKNRERIAGVSIFLVVLLMFRSVGSLSWVGLVILLLIIGGWLFYASRRN